MFGKPHTMEMAGALSVHAAGRQAAIARNIANADTPGYRTTDAVPFGETYREATSGMRATRSGHLGAGDSPAGAELVDRPALGAMSPNRNNVSLEAEMVAAAEVRRENDLALAVYRSSLDILRSSLGRR
ncbi:MAG: FlgB family protein [Paracoccaceae bacterium]